MTRRRRRYAPALPIPPEKDVLVDIAGVARIAGVPKDTAEQWRKRSLRAARERRGFSEKPWRGITPKPFPPPSEMLGNVPAWRTAVVIEWLLDTGRLEARPAPVTEGRR